MLKMKDFKIIEEYYARIKKIINQIKLYRENMSNKRVANKLLLIVAVSTKDKKRGGGSDI